MTAWETEDEYAAAACNSLPSPTDTPRSNRSRSRQNRISTGPMHTPPLKGYNRHSRSNDVNISESISMLNPHRFTPTLHANLVSEILSLRRDQEEKKKVIESLETSLLESRKDQESVSAELSLTTQENNSLKRKLDLLEGGTSSALSELAKERDIAIQSVTEIKGRLILAQKKIRSREEELDRSHVLWTREKSSLEEQRRRMERKVHIAESRLKKVLEEVTEFEIRQSEIKSIQQASVEIQSSQHQSSRSGCFKRESINSNLGFSLSHRPPSAVGPEASGLSLADELDLKFEAEPDNFVDWESVSSRDHSRPSSSNSSENDILSTSSTRTSPRPSSTRGRTLIKKAENRASGNSPEKIIEPVSLNLGAHLSTLTSSDIEPRSIKLSPYVTSSPLDEQLSQTPIKSFDINPENHSYLKNSVTPQLNPTKSVASQTSGLLGFIKSSAIKIEKAKDMRPASTQTDLVSSEATSLSVKIPSIQLHPPSPTQTLPFEQVPPPQFKDASCQVQIPAVVPIKSTSVQTEEIRIDKRIYSLPSHLHPSSISSNPSSPVLKTAASFSCSPSLSKCASETLKSTLPEKSSGSCPIEKHLFSARIFSDESQNTNSKNSSLDDDEHADDDLSESDHKTRLHAIKQRKKCSFRQNSAPNDSTAPSTSNIISVQTETDETANKSYSLIGSRDSELGNSKNYSIIHLQDLVLQDDTLRAQSHVYSDLSYSSSFSEKPPEPPFPIPLRRSSRRVTPGSILDDDIDSPTLGQGRRVHRRPGSVKKLRPNVILPRISKNGIQKNDYRTPQRSISTIDQQCFTPPPIPEHDISPQRKINSQQRERCSPTSNSFNQTIDSGSESATSVVGAIAQTMVGEWMFKYVRRRKSIGVAESNLDAETSNGVRHKRWVWLAPYERLVMWSTKQPTSGSALMGKSGRKLIIQSVLDVKDDNSPIKGVHLFNRSILILTPSRALKFTATSMERHYIWLTALSFLAHSSQAIPEPISPSIVNPLPKPQPFFEACPSPRNRQFGVRQDSIRLAKSKLALASNSALASARSTYEIPMDSYYSMQSSDQAAFAPIVPRFTDRAALHSALNNNPHTFTPRHQRRRSNTGSRYPSHLSILGDRSATAFPLGTIKNKPYSTSITPTEMQFRRESPYVFSHNSAINSRSALPSPVTFENNVSNRSNCERLNSVGTGTVRMEAFVSSPENLQTELKHEFNAGWENINADDSSKLNRRNCGEPSLEYSALSSLEPEETQNNGITKTPDTRSLSGHAEDSWGVFRGF